jgi:hypothetical protein
MAESMAPSHASASMFGVLISDPVTPRSANPISSAKMRMTFGFSDCRTAGSAFEWLAWSNCYLNLKVASINSFQTTLWQQNLLRFSSSAAIRTACSIIQSGLRPADRCGNHEGLVLIGERQ